MGRCYNCQGDVEGQSRDGQGDGGEESSGNIKETEVMKPDDCRIIQVEIVNKL